MYYLFKFASIVVPRLPRLFVSILADIAGIAAFFIASKARKQATINMAHVLGKEVVETSAGHRRLRRTVIKMFQNNVLNYMNLFTIPSIPPEKILNSMVIEGIEHIEDALANGKGLIMFTAHLGPFDFLAQWLSLKGFKTTIPVERLKDQRMLDLITKLRNSQGMQYIPLGGSNPLRTIIQALRDNQIVLFTTDRAVEGKSVVKPFFGEPARLPIGPVSLSLRTGAPLVGGFGSYVSSKLMVGDIVPLSLELTEEEQANTDKLMYGVIEMMERFIKAHPEQWVVFSPIWISDSAKTS
jgi:lauroyl/myristoyl acyltransferase